MMQLVRVAENERGMFGVLLWDRRPFAISLEPPWRDNQEDISCIPQGEYKCVRVQSPKFGETFKVIGVDGRTDILFHWGNELEDTEGCILIGEEFGKLNGFDAILSSMRAFKELMRLTVDMDGFDLLIRYAFARG